MGSDDTSFRGAAAQLALLALVFFFVFTARIGFSPLLPAIEKDLGLSHALAASFFLFISIGYVPATLLSGLVSARIGHRATILASILAAGAVMLLISRSQSLGAIRAGLVLLGAVSGLYLPSAIPTATSLARRGGEGRALAVHELAPNLAFILVPLAAAACSPACPGGPSSWASAWPPWLRAPRSWPSGAAAISAASRPA